jgi:peptidylprolyl isomerase
VFIYEQVDLKLVLDGYNSPLTAGNFVDLVNRGFYDKRVITRADGFVVQTGDADPR